MSIHEPSVTPLLAAYQRTRMIIIVEDTLVDTKMLSTAKAFSKAAIHTCIYICRTVLESRVGRLKCFNSTTVYFYRLILLKKIKLYTVAKFALKVK